jgi:hypothetical protein
VLEEEAGAPAAAAETAVRGAELVPLHLEVVEAAAPGGRKFRLRGRAFLATWNSSRFGATPAEWEQTWKAFLDHVKWLQGEWGFRGWSAKMERSLRSTEVGKVHLHGYFSGFEEELDTTDLDTLVSRGSHPRLDANKENRGPTFWMAAKWHGHFYTYCPEKDGSLFQETTVPPWEAYTPEAWWALRLWKAHKLGHEKFLALSARLRDGHSRRKADAEAVMAWEATDRARKRQREALELMQPRKRPFRVFPPVEVWRGQYVEPGDRYNLLVLHGPSKTGKTEFAKSLFGAERTLVIDCQNAAVPDMKDYVLGHHLCVVFDEVDSGAKLIAQNKKLMQAHSTGAKVRDICRRRWVCCWWFTRPLCSVPGGAVRDAEVLLRGESLAGGAGVHHELLAAEGGRPRGQGLARQERRRRGDQLAGVAVSPRGWRRARPASSGPRRGTRGRQRARRGAAEGADTEETGDRARATPWGERSRCCRL